MTSQFHGTNGFSVSGSEGDQKTVSSEEESEAFEKIKAGLEEALELAIKDVDAAGRKAVEAIEKLKP
jgi:hypothetical protein